MFFPPRLAVSRSDAEPFNKKVAKYKPAFSAVLAEIRLVFLHY